MDARASRGGKMLKTGFRGKFGLRMTGDISENKSKKIEARVMV
jgi:hypothetical protein